MALKEVKGQAGLFQDTINDQVVNIRELPVLDLRLSEDALYERFVALIKDNHQAYESVELLAKEIEQMEYPKYSAITPSYARALATQAYLLFLIVAQQKAAEELTEYYGDLFNHLR